MLQGSLSFLSRLYLLNYFFFFFPIGFNYHSPNAPVEAKVEPEIITIDNAYRHPKKYEVPALPTGTYAPEPITAKPVSEYEEPTEETDDTAVVYGVPEIAIEVPKASI